MAALAARPIHLIKTDPDLPQYAKQHYQKRADLCSRSQWNMGNELAKALTKRGAGQVFVTPEPVTRIPYRE